MKKLSLISFLVLNLLSACSTASIQTQRLNTAESYIQQTEQLLVGSLDDDLIRAAQQDLDTANAYLATLKDYRKLMTDDEMKRYKALKQRSDEIMKRIR